MTTWDLKDTCGLVKKVFGLSQLELTSPCLRSITDRQMFADYHYRETLRLLAAYKHNHLLQIEGLHSFELRRAGNEKMRDAFETLMAKAGAHVTACVQSLHAVPDIVANGVYFACGLNLDPYPLADDKVSFTTVRKRMVGRISVKDIDASLAQLVIGDDHKHISALSNLSKHRSIVRVGLHEDLTGLKQEKYEFRFSSFERTNTPFAEVSVASLLQREFDH